MTVQERADMRGLIGQMRDLANQFINLAMVIGEESQVSVGHMILGAAQMAERNVDLDHAAEVARNHNQQQTPRPGPTLVDDKPESKH